MRQTTPRTEADDDNAAARRFRARGQPRFRPLGNRFDPRVVLCEQRFAASSFSSAVTLSRKCTSCFCARPARADDANALHLPRVDAQHGRNAALSSSSLPKPAV